MADNAVNTNPNPSTRTGSGPSPKARAARLQALKKAAANQPTPEKGPRKDQLTELAESAGFVVLMGFFILTAGMIFYVQFHNRFSEYVYLMGILLVVYGIAIKVADLCRSIFWGGRK